jgi:hypothetical protein
MVAERSSGGARIFYRGHINFDNKKNKIKHKIQLTEEWNNSTKFSIIL